MTITTVATRLALAYSALVGRLDDVPAMAKELVEIRDRLVRLNKAMCDLGDQRDYWYRLFNGMGMDFEHTQAVLCEHIDKLRKRIPGEWDGKRFYEGKVQEHWHKRWVEPNHPVNPDACPPGFEPEVPPKPVDPAKV